MTGQFRSGISPWAARLATGLLAAAVGCRQPLPEPELRARLAAQAAERARFKSLTAAYDMSMSGRGPDGGRRKLRCSGRLVAARGRGLRMQGAKILGMAKIFDLLLVGDRLRLNFVYGHKFYTGSISKVLAERGAEKLVGGTRPDLAALLFPVRSLEGPDAPELVTGKREACLVWRSKEGAPLRRTVLDAASARPLRTEIFGERRKRLAVIHYHRPVAAGGLYPAGGFRVRASGRARFRMKLRFVNPVVNGPVKEAAFRLKAPAGIEVVDLDRKEKPREGSGPSPPGPGPEKK